MFANLLHSATGTASQAYSLLRSEKFTYNGKNTFTISGTPNTNAALLFVVNGIMYYDEADVTFDKATKTLTWKSDIPLTSKDRIMVLYSEDVEYGGGGKTIDDKILNQIQANTDAIASIKANGVTIDTSKFLKTASWNETTGVLELEAAVDNDDEE